MVRASKAKLRKKESAALMREKKRLKWLNYVQDVGKQHPEGNEDFTKSNIGGVSVESTEVPIKPSEVIVQPNEFGPLEVTVGPAKVPLLLAEMVADMVVGPAKVPVPAGSVEMDVRPVEVAMGPAEVLLCPEVVPVGPVEQVEAPVMLIEPMEMNVGLTEVPVQPTQVPREEGRVEQLMCPATSEISELGNKSSLLDQETTQEKQKNELQVPDYHQMDFFTKKCNIYSTGADFRSFISVASSDSGVSVVGSSDKSTYDQALLDSTSTMKIYEHPPSFNDVTNSDKVISSYEETHNREEMRMAHEVPPSIKIKIENTSHSFKTAAGSSKKKSDGNKKPRCSAVEANRSLSQLPTDDDVKKIPSALKRSGLLAKIELTDDKDYLELDQSENIFTSIKKIDKIISRITRCFKCLDSPIRIKFRSSDLNLSSRTIEFHCKSCGKLGQIQESDMIPIPENTDSSQSGDEDMDNDLTNSMNEKTNYSGESDNEENNRHKEMNVNISSKSQHEEYASEMTDLPSISSTPTKSRRSKGIRKSKTMIKRKPRNSHNVGLINLFGAQFTRGVLNGSGNYDHAAELLSSLNINPISRHSYLNILRIFVRKLEPRFNNVKSKVAQEIKEQYVKRGNDLKEDMMNIAVSFDGSWMTKGHGSLIGIGFVCEIETGIVLDVGMLSKYCAKCEQYLGKNKGKISEEEIEKWINKHKSSCDLNYSKEKSSGGMEAEIAIQLFSRSVENGLRYTTIVSDQDSSTYKRLKEAKIYGEKYLIIKENCLNHSNKAVFKELKGGKSGLTDKIAEYFANIYRWSIKKYLKNYEGISKSVLGFILHHSSSEDNVTHDLCQTGKTSWCGYQKDIANGIDVSDWHQRCKRQFILDKKTSDILVTYFETKLTDNVLNFISGKTQNVNESLHSKVWHQISKNIFTTINHVKYVCYKVAIDHNFGYGRYDILSDLKVPLSKIYRDRLNYKEGRRTRDLSKKTSKNKKRVLGRYKKDKEYQSGGFDT